MRMVKMFVCAALLAGCASDGIEGVEGEKIDVSGAPAVTARDSKTAPVNMGGMLIGRYENGSFGPSRGWVGYEIELTGGTVDLMAHGQTAAGQPQDTVLWVYGPKKANGNFPSTAIAFNDDEEPGVSVFSHIQLNVPKKGVYRVVLSTYDNAVSYPRNVARGDYKLIVKCPGDFGSCGPAASFEGGACWADEECVDNTHCEGEVTCAPGTECLYVNQGTCVADYVWMTYAPRQCGDNPWQTQSWSGDGQDAGVEGELLAVDNWLESNGVQLTDLGFLHKATPMMTCQACTCARGDTLVVKARGWDASFLAGLGFTPLAPGVFRETAPVQCGGNPWEENGDDVLAEEQNVVSWLAGAGAQLHTLGFVYPAESMMVCLACNCMRGDRLLVSPVDASSDGVVAGFGFGDIYRP